MHICWGKNPRYKFISGGELRNCSPPGAPAVFAITYKQNPDTKPKAHTVLYFGHTEDLEKELPSVNEHIYELWNKQAGHSDALYVFMHLMPGTTHRQRENVHWQLVSEYWPAANN
jgi:hypothetical protein